MRETLGVALDAEILSLERRIVRAWCILSFFGCLGGIAAGIAIAPRVGYSTAAISFAIFVTTALVGVSLDRTTPPPAARFAVAAIEATLPWIFLVTLAAVQGPAYALSSWLPPMIFCAVLVAEIARLRPVGPIVVGVIGTFAHLVCYFAFVRPRLGGAIHASVIFQPSMQLTRALSLSIAGGIAALVTSGLRIAIGRADSLVREKELFGKYRLVREIGVGGMGSVHEAVYCPEGGFERKMAVKILHPHLVLQPQFVEGFRREAEIGARLTQSNIVQVADFGRHQDAYFLAMEFVEGKTLAETMANSRTLGLRIGSDLVGAISSGVLLALAFAHEGLRMPDGAPMRVVHRDVCPHNVMLSRHGDVKLADFGIARVLHDVGGVVTQSLAGHYGYMAPEQLRGKHIDERCDLFAVGVIVWELLAGRRLFSWTEGGPDLLAAIEEPILPISTVRADIAREWDTVLLRALARAPGERFESAAQMRDAILEIPGARPDRANDLVVAWLDRVENAAPVDQVNVPTVTAPRSR